MGMTFDDIVTNATQVNRVAESTNGFSTTDGIFYSYDLAAGPLTISGTIFTLSAEPEDVVNYVGVIFGAGEFTGPGATTPGLWQSTDGMFSYEMTLAQWLAEGSPEFSSVNFTDDFDDDDGFDFLQFAVTCFAPGTDIATPGGEVAVETLQIGDLIMGSDGPVAVKWIGRRSAYTLFSRERVQPVRIMAGALAAGQPHRDLTVTPDHGMILDGMVINASALVNGTTIDWVPLDDLPDRVSYYHVETENHDVILANGAPAETFIDYAARRGFDNYAEYLALYGEDRSIPEMPYPRISSERMLPGAVRARLSGTLGYATV